MPFSNKFKEKNGQQILREALSFTGKNFPRLLLLFIIPFTLINITPILSTINLSTLFKKTKITPFTIFLSEKANKECKLVNVTQKATPYKAGWLRIEKIDRNKKIAVIINKKIGETKYHIDPKDQVAIWIDNNKISTAPPAAFFMKQLTGEKESSTTLQFVTNLIKQLLFFIISTLLQLLLFSWILLSYFNKPPITFTEIFQLAKNNFVNFMGVYALLILLIFLVPAFTNPLFIFIALFVVLIKFALAPSATLTEGSRPFAAIKKSIILSQGNAKQFVIFTVALISTIIASYTLSTVIAATILGYPLDEVTRNLIMIKEKTIFIWPQPIFLIYLFTSFITSALLPIMCHYLYGTYMDIRIRREGLHNKSKEGFFGSQAEKTEGQQ